MPSPFPPQDLCPHGSLCLKQYSWPNPSCQIGTQLRCHLHRENPLFPWAKLLSRLFPLWLCLTSLYLNIYSPARYRFSRLDVGRSSAWYPDSCLPQGLCHLYENMNGKVPHKCQQVTNWPEDGRVIAQWVQSFCSGWWKVLEVDSGDGCVTLCM